MYKIETIVNGNWTDDAVGQPNEFKSKREAARMIPELARIFNAPKSEFRIVKR